MILFFGIVKIRFYDLEKARNDCYEYESGDRGIKKEAR